jgi:hypothetical protein
MPLNKQAHFFAPGTIDNADAPVALQPLEPENGDWLFSSEILEFAFMGVVAVVAVAVVAFLLGVAHAWLT